MSKREYIPLKTKLASELLARGDIDYEHAKVMNSEQINSLYHWDHYPIRHADGGPSEPWNVRAILIASHREKTAKHDAPDMAHERKVRRAQEEHVRRQIARDVGEPRAERRGSRLQSRGFDKTKSRKFSGQVVPRKHKERGNG